MHIQIFNYNQNQLLPLVKQFKREFYLVGGTAIALHIGKRSSIDFDLFKFSPIKPKNIIQIISDFGYPYSITRRVTEQLNVTINDVKFTFYQYPFKIKAAEHLNDIDYTEPIEYLVQTISDDEIKNFLIDKAIDIFDE